MIEDQLARCSVFDDRDDEDDEMKLGTKCSENLGNCEARWELVVGFGDCLFVIIGRPFSLV